LALGHLYHSGLWGRRILAGNLRRYLRLGHEKAGVKNRMPHRCLIDASYMPHIFKGMRHLGSIYGASIGNAFIGICKSVIYEGYFGSFCSRRDCAYCGSRSRMVSKLLPLLAGNIIVLLTGTDPNGTEGIMVFTADSCCFLRKISCPAGIVL
jgi:hypothetical protein